MSDSPTTPSAPNAAVQLLVDELGLESTRELVEIYLTEFSRLRAQLASGDSQQQRFAAHSLKSSAHHMGAMELAAMMAGFEIQLERPGCLPLGDSEIARVDHAFEENAAGLRAFLSR